MSENRTGDSLFTLYVNETYDAETETIQPWHSLKSPDYHCSCRGV